MAVTDPSNSPHAKAVIKAIATIEEMKDGELETAASQTDIRSELRESRSVDTYLSATLNDLVQGKFLAEVSTKDGGRSYELTILGRSRAQHIVSRSFKTNLEIVKESMSASEAEMGEKVPLFLQKATALSLPRITEAAWKKIWIKHNELMATGQYPEGLNTSEEVATEAFAKDHRFGDRLQNALKVTIKDQQERTPIPPKPDDWQPRSRSVEPPSL